MARYDRPRRPADPGHVTEAERKLIAEAVEDLKGVDPFRRRGDPDVTPWDRIEARLGEALGLDGKPPNDFYALLVDKREWARGDRFHWTAPAYALLGKTVVESVLRELGARGQQGN